jgi:hypothetical protein
MNSECVQFLRNPQLIDDREINSLTLAAIAQSGIVKFDFGFHRRNSAWSGNEDLRHCSGGCKGEMAVEPHGCRWLAEPIARAR